MPNEDFYTPTDIDALRMENELLSFEVRFLKAQIAQTDRLKARITECEHQLERSEQVEKDFILLLRRLAHSRFAPFFRLRRSFRDLERQYLSTSKY